MGLPPRMAAAARRIVAAVGRARLLPLALLAAGVLVVTQVTQNDPAPTVAPPSPPRGFYGVGLAGPPTAADIGSLRDVGAATARVTFDWRTVQPTASAPPAFGATDPLVRRLAEAGLEVFPQFISTPGWLTPNPVTPPLFSGPARSGWRKFLTATVARYGPHGSFWRENPAVPYDPIRAWQVWNEPNAPGYFAPRPSPSAYAELLRISAAAIRRADPQATIVLAGMFQTSGQRPAIFSWQFLRRLYTLGARANFDVVGVHPYYPDLAGVARQIERMRAVSVSENDSGTPIWVDEIGWGSDTTGSKLNLGPDGQATMLRGAFDYILANRLRLDIGRLIWYPLRDSAPAAAGACGFCGSEGLLDAQGNPKPAWSAYRRFAATP